MTNEKLTLGYKRRKKINKEIVENLPHVFWAMIPEIPTNIYGSWINL